MMKVEKVFLIGLVIGIMFTTPSLARVTEVFAEGTIQTFMPSDISKIHSSNLSPISRIYLNPVPFFYAYGRVIDLWNFRQ